MELQQLRDLANLARIKFTDEELATTGQDFASILGYVDQLNQADISDVRTRAMQTNVARADVATPFNDVDIMLADAPESLDGFYKVPKIL